MIDSGAPEEVKNWPRHLKGFFQKRARYAAEGNVVLISRESTKSTLVNKVMMPTMLRDEVLETLHRSHIVAKSMEARAKETGLARYDQGPRRTARHAVSLLPASQGQLLELR